MYRVIKATKASGYYYRYEVRWITPAGKDNLYRACNTLSEAESAAFELLDRFFKDPNENQDDKAFLIQNMYILDVKTNKDITPDSVLHQGDILLKQI